MDTTPAPELVAGKPPETSTAPAPGGLSAVPTSSGLNQINVDRDSKGSRLSANNTRKTVLEEHGLTLGRQIGTGTYAKVKLAYSEEFKSNVAIKCISKFKAPAEYLKKFLPREIDVVKGLRHENLIRFFQSIETTHRVYIIMEYAEKGSLLDLIRANGTLAEPVARNYFKQLISAICYCHSQGVVHRDIKCENLLFDSNYKLKLIDFGFARRGIKADAPKPVLSETYCGSYAYASPEVLKGIPYDPHLSDAWATGVVLFAMVYGRLPFDGSNYNQLLKQVQSKIIFPRQPPVATNCRNLISKILAPLKSRLRVDQMQEEQWCTETPEENSTSTSKPVAATS